jgi:hypothetical protein
MVSAKDLKNMMDSEPFQPFCLRLRDGKTYEVNSPCAAFVKQQEIEIGLDFDKDGIMVGSVRCAITGIARIEKL